MTRPAHIIFVITMLCLCQSDARGRRCCIPPAKCRNPCRGHGHIGAAIAPAPIIPAPVVPIPPPLPPPIPPRIIIQRVPVDRPYPVPVKVFVPAPPHPPPIQPPQRIIRIPVPVPRPVLIRIPVQLPPGPPPPPLPPPPPRIIRVPVAVPQPVAVPVPIPAPPQPAPPPPPPPPPRIVPIPIPVPQPVPVPVALPPPPPPPAPPPPPPPPPRLIAIPVPVPRRVPVYVRLPGPPPPPPPPPPPRPPPIIVPRPFPVPDPVPVIIHDPPHPPPPPPPPAPPLYVRRPFPVPHRVLVAAGPGAHLVGGPGTPLAGGGPLGGPGIRSFHGPGIRSFHGPLPAGLAAGLNAAGLHVPELPAPDLPPPPAPHHFIGPGIHHGAGGFPFGSPAQFSLPAGGHASSDPGLGLIHSGGPHLPSLAGFSSAALPSHISPSLPEVHAGTNVGLAPTGGNNFPNFPDIQSHVPFVQSPVDIPNSGTELLLGSEGGHPYPGQAAGIHSVRYKTLNDEWRCTRNQIEQAKGNICCNVVQSVALKRTLRLASHSGDLQRAAEQCREEAERSHGGKWDCVLSSNDFGYSHWRVNNHYCKVSNNGLHAVAWQVDAQLKSAQ